MPQIDPNRINSRRIPNECGLRFSENPVEHHGVNQRKLESFSVVRAFFKNLQKKTRKGADPVLLRLDRVNRAQHYS